MGLLPFKAQLLKQGREYRETSLICVQDPESLIPEVISETFCKICLRQEGRGINYLKESLRLTPEQADVLNKLPVGTGITKLMSDRWPYPFKLEIPFVMKPKYVTDTDVIVRMEPIYKNMKVKPRIDLLDKLNLRVSDHGRIYVPESQKKGVPKFDHRINIWETGLFNIAENPDATIVQRKKMEDLTNSEFEKRESDLIRNNLIKHHRISFGRKGDTSVYAELLPEGFQYLGIPFQPLKGKGSFEHKIGQYKISKTMKNLSIECRGADLGWIKPGGEKIAIEIELGCNEHILTNVRRDLNESGFSRVWIICKNEKMREAIGYLLKTGLEPELLEKSETKLFREILE
jgi:hypothetical protein